MKEEYPNLLSAAIAAHGRQISRWAARKGFREACPACEGLGYGLARISEPAPSCSTCGGSGVDRSRHPNFGQQVALVHSELSELLESHRKNPEAKDEHCPGFLSLEVEAADVVIWILDMASACGWRLGEAIEAKMAYNEGRPIKHGKAY